MRRRTLLKAGLGITMGSKLGLAQPSARFDKATHVLSDAVASGQVAAASLFAQQGESVQSSALGAAESDDAIFLLASISKPMTVAAVMTLYDEQLFDLDDPVRKFLPEFTGDGRDDTRMQQLLTHVSGLPDQLPENARLRASHAPLSEFVECALRTGLLFEPGTRYSYSSMAILLAAEIAQRISGQSMADLVDERVFQPLGMKHSALGIGRFSIGSLMQCQVDEAAPESGSGDPAAKNWDWNSDYWRKLGAPWGGAHGSAKDVAKFLQAFLHPQDEWLRPETARLMIRNHNPAGLHPRGLGFDLGRGLHGPQGSSKVFGHGGSTGTLCWADPTSGALCVVLTTLPANAVNPHPRILASEAVANAL